MKKLSIVFISDTHNKHKQLSLLPEADVIIHCGDLTSVGKEHEVRNFLKWYSNLEQYRYKIFISGNHDWLFEKNRILARRLIPKNVIYLEDSGVTIDGFNFYGSPVQKIFYDWAFNRPEEKLKQHWEAIPNDIDILITHEAPYSIKDFGYDLSHQGSPSLYYEIFNRIKPIVHTFGHYHSGYGVQEIEGINFINASNLNDDYNCVNSPILVEIDENKSVTVISC